MENTVTSVFFFIVLRTAEEKIIYLRHIALGHERNQVEVMTPQLSAPIAVFIRIGISVDFHYDMFGFSVKPCNELRKLDC